jgi:hypothetical protein
MVNAKENKMTVTALTQEEKVARRRQRAVEREAQEFRDNEQREAELAARREKMPGVLFNMMVKAEELRKAGMSVNVQFHAAMPSSLAYNSSQAGLPGVLFAFHHRAGQQGPFSDDYSDEVGLTVHAETWEVELVERKMVEMQVVAEERAARRKVAEEAKKLLTPEQLAALKEFS